MYNKNSTDNDEKSNKQHIPPKKLSVAASVAVFEFQIKAFLMVRRRTDPFRDRYAFPGGYIDVDQEDIYQTAVRELYEETGLKVSTKELCLLDVRSNPTRDPRGHVIDIGFFCAIGDKYNILSKTDETYPEWVSMERMYTLEFAFDHKDMFNKCLEHISFHLNVK